MHVMVTGALETSQGPKGMWTGIDEYAEEEGKRKPKLEPISFTRV